MIDKLFMYMVGMTCVILAIILPEIKYLQNCSKTMSVLLNTSVTPLFTFITVLGSIFVIPLLMATAILIGFKKYIFNHYKSLNGSFRLIALLYLGSNTLVLYFTVLEFLFKLSSLPNQYFLLRCMRLYNTYHSYEPLVFIFLFFYFHSMMFIVFLFFAEFFVAYKQLGTQFRFRSLLRHNKLLTYIVTSTLLIYIGAFVLFLKNFYEFSNEPTFITQALLVSAVYGLVPAAVSNVTYWLVVTSRASTV